MALLARTLTSHGLLTEELRAVVQQYSRARRLLLEYDEKRLAWAPVRPVAPETALTLDEARAAVSALGAELATRGEAGALFGQERSDALAGILGAMVRLVLNLLEEGPA